MRGKNILRFALIAMLLTVIVNVGSAPAEKTEVYITPDRIPEDPSALGHIGDEYYMSVNIANVENLYAVGFTIKYAPFGRTLTPADMVQGDFLSEGGSRPVVMLYDLDVFEGELEVGMSRMGVPLQGAYGSGTLMTFKFVVTEGGSSPIEIVNVVLFDPDLNEMDYVTFGSSYTGSTADLIRMNMPDGRQITVGTTGDFNVKARNDGDVPIAVRARVEFERVSDGRRIRIYAGQTYYGGYLGADAPFTYLYCDGYDGSYDEWDKWGSSPYLDAKEDGNLVNSTVNDAWDGFYSFEDITMPYLGIYNVISNVDFYGYTKSASTGPDIDPYCFTESGGESYSFMWTDSMGGTTEWAWTGVRYYFGQYDFPEYYGFPLTEEAVDNMELLLTNYHGDDGLQVDALRAKVEFATIIPVESPIYIIPAGEELELDPIIWFAASDHIGKYTVTATLEYSVLYPDFPGLAHWKNTGEKTRTITFWVDA